MPDRETVIKELHDARRYLEYKEWSDRGASPHIDAINDALALLKEKEAVKPEKEHSGSGVTWWNVCGNCKTAINPNDKFCHECGRPVLWEGR